jgi:hypothetical protein
LIGRKIRPPTRVAAQLAVLPIAIGRACGNYREWLLESWYEALDTVGPLARDDRYSR